MAPATSILVRNRSRLGELGDAALRTVPLSWRGLLRGPVTEISLGRTAESRRRISPFRPVDLIVTLDLVLQRKMSVPKSSRQDISSAIELFLRHDTPFDPGEVGVHALELPSGPGAEQSAYMVRVLPRAVIDDAMRYFRIRRSQLRKVLIANASGTPDEIDLAPALFPRWRWAKWLVTIPIAVVISSICTLAFGNLAQLQTRVAELDQQVATQLAVVKSLGQQLDTLHRGSTGEAAAMDLVQGTPSSFEWFEQVRKRLPGTTEISRIEMHSGELRLSVRSPDVLADVQKLGASRLWSANLEGAITADPASKQDAATILLRGDAGGQI